MEITESMRHEESASRWNLLPDDILHKILLKLWFLDRVHAVATCKNWNIPTPAISKYLPWLIEQDWSVVPGSNGRQKLSCKLNLYEALNLKVYPPICRVFDLGHKREKLIDKAAKVFKNAVQRPSVKVLHTKFGWVLVMISMYFPGGKKRSSYSFLVLYNPFVQSFRFLPTLEIPEIDIAAFSRPPTSSDCVVYTLTEVNSTSRSFLRIHSYRPCDDRSKWKVATYNVIHYDQRMYYRSALVMEDGTFYCLGYKNSSDFDDFSKEERSLIAFNSSNSIKQKKNSSKLQTEPLVGLDDDLDILTAQLAEHEGELFLVCCCCRSSSAWDTSLWYHMIYWYNKSANCWSFKQRLDHPVAVQIGNVWEMGGRFWCFENRPYDGAIEKLFPSYHLDSSDSEDSDDDALSFGKVRFYRELQWLPLGHGLAPPLNGATLSTINGSQSDGLSTINGSKWDKP